nr:MAG TPA: Single strand binding protein [Caudoviricetes sp.]
MARSKNSVSLIGVVGKDAELRQTQQGVHYVQISLATSTGGYKKKDGTDVPEVTQWHRIVAWNNLADFTGNYVKKGMKIAVDGMITYRTYKNQQGVDVYTTDIVADSIVLMTIPQGQQQNVGAAPVQNVAPQQQGVVQPTGGYTQPQQLVQQQPANYQQGGYTQPNTGAPFPPAPDDLPF